MGVLKINSWRYLYLFNPGRPATCKHFLHIDETFLFAQLDFLGLHFLLKLCFLWNWKLQLFTFFHILKNCSICWVVVTSSIIHVVIYDNLKFFFKFDGLPSLIWEQESTLREWSETRSLSTKMEGRSRQA